MSVNLEKFYQACNLESNYLEDLSTRKVIGKQYGAKVEFEVDDGTFEQLIEMGATHSSAVELYPDLPRFKKGMTVPKSETCS